MRRNRASRDGSTSSKHEVRGAPRERPLFLAVAVAQNVVLTA